MASILKVDTLTGVATAGSISVTGEGNSTTTNLQQGLAKAWTNGQADGSAIRDSFNIASLTDGGTGIYTHTFTSAMSNANYSKPNTNPPHNSTSGGVSVLLGSGEGTNGGAATTAFIIHGGKANSTTDHDIDHTVTIHGDLA